MHRIVFVGETLQQHLELMERTPEVYRPARCPHCQWAGVRVHGRYFRKGDRSAGGDLNPVPLPRFDCGSCKGTCSRLPLCLAPRRWYGWAVQQSVLLFALLGGSLRSAGSHCGVSRHTAGRWCRWLQERSREFEFFLRGRFPELGRAVDGQEFWRTCLARLSLAEAMAWLDAEVTVP